MEMINQALLMSPEMQATFAKEERRRERENQKRLSIHGPEGEARFAKAEEKRQRKNAQRLAASLP